MAKRNFSTYGLIILILLLHFFFRAHRPTHQPFFIDEHRHIERAAGIANFETHPAEKSLGKFLLYVWIAPFHTDPEHALHMSRTAVAMFSLLGSAALYATTRRLFSKRAALIAIIFYALLPYALFYERMVLADGIAAALGALTAWQSVYLAQKPSYRRAAMVGLLVALASMAKLTMMFIALLPIAAIVCLGQWEQGGLSKKLRAHFKHYFKFLVAAGCTTLLMWIVPVLIPAAIAKTQGVEYVLVDQSLLDESVFSTEDTGKLDETWNKAELLISEPMTIIGLLVIVLGLWKARRQTLFGMAWLLIIWVPILILVVRIHTRYLMPGMYPVAMLMGGGLGTLTQLKLPSIPANLQGRVWRTAVGLILAIWAITFAWPFAVNASNDAPALKMPYFDNRDYFQSRLNAYGLLPALGYLQQTGERVDGQVPVMMVAYLCDRLELYAIEPVQLTCLGQELNGPTVTPDIWTPLIDQSTTGHAIYVIVEQAYGETTPLENAPIELDTLQWERLAVFRRPKNGLWVTVWQVIANPSA
ncbi:MAG: glycosyltransferase family 39 protein [Chloroflexi bacterium]|nr:glycosyltransferase family 39 protein [Chloroflexota bacterium]